MAALAAVTEPKAARTNTLRIGLVNNMPDSALEATERQFAALLYGSGMDVALIGYALPGVVRGEAGTRHMAARGYRDALGIVREGLDGVIVTGMEPKAGGLRDEPYWPYFANLLDWIANDGPPAIFSCLAAHAAVLHYDGIERRRLEHKCFGLFEHARLGRHALTESLLGPIRVAHSRWNEVRAEELVRAGYRILTQSPAAGVDLFVRDARSPMIFFQGHPEYDAQSLAREYKRDVRRFLAHEADSYPRLPAGYFNAEDKDRLEFFQARALAWRHESLMQCFPQLRVAAAGGPAPSIYRNWLSHLRAPQAAEAMS